MRFTPLDFPTGFDAEQLRLSLIATHGIAFDLQTSSTEVVLNDLLISAQGALPQLVDATCRTHFAIDWNAKHAAATSAAQSVDQANAADPIIAILKAMSNAEMDAWFAANVTTAPQAIIFLKRLAKIIIRRL